MILNDIPTKNLRQKMHPENKDEELNRIMDEFILRLNHTELNTERVEEIRDKLNQALDKKLSGENALERIQQLSVADMSRLDQLDQLEFLLTTSNLDSRQAKKITFKAIFLKVIKTVIGFLFVTLGFAMIIMPAPPYFEMFTIFYFTESDGITLMDLISLIIIATGIYVIVKSISNMKPHE